MYKITFISRDQNDNLYHSPAVNWSVVPRIGEQICTRLVVCGGPGWALERDTLCVYVATVKNVAYCSPAAHRSGKFTIEVHLNQPPEIVMGADATPDDNPEPDTPPMDMLVKDGMLTPESIDKLFAAAMSVDAKVEDFHKLCEQEIVNEAQITIESLRQEREDGDPEFRGEDQLTLSQAIKFWEVVASQNGKHSDAPDEARKEDTRKHEDAKATAERLRQYKKDGNPEHRACTPLSLSQAIEFWEGVATGEKRKSVDISVHAPDEARKKANKKTIGEPDQDKMSLDTQGEQDESTAILKRLRQYKKDTNPKTKHFPKRSDPDTARKEGQVILGMLRKDELDGKPTDRVDLLTQQTLSQQIGYWESHVEHYGAPDTNADDRFNPEVQDRREEAKLTLERLRQELKDGKPDYRGGIRWTRTEAINFWRSVA